MKKIFFLGFIFFGSIKVRSQIIDTQKIYNSLINSVNVLSNDKMNGRLTGSMYAQNAADFIASEFKKAGLDTIPNCNDYFQKFTITSYKNIITTCNVIGSIKGQIAPDTIIIFSAHYDHIGNGKFAALVEDETDTIYNGANDNASGVALLIELAKHYVNLKENKYSILFMAFSGEEMGLLGSRIANESINPGNLKAVINFDMMGRPLSDNQQKCIVVSRYSTKKTIKELNKSLGKGVDFFIKDQFPNEHLEDRSDHASFKQCKNSFTFTCISPTDKFYHSPFDESKTIDFDFLTATTSKIIESCKIFLK